MVKPAINFKLIIAEKSVHLALKIPKFAHLLKH